MIGLIGKPEQEKRVVKNFVAALFECLLEAVELIPIACATLLFVAALLVVGDMVYQLMFDPNAVDVASRLNTLSIDPNKWLPRS
jgi:hypothetical protein